MYCGKILPETFGTIKNALKLGEEKPNTLHEYPMKNLSVLQRNIKKKQ